MINQAEPVTKEQVKAIERKLEQCTLESLRDPDHGQPIDEDESDTVSYDRYSQYRDEQDQRERAFIEGTNSR